jgi:hypothetical protein
VLSHSAFAASASVTTTLPNDDAAPSKLSVPTTSLSAAVASVSLVGPQWSVTAATADAYPAPAASLLVAQQAYRVDLVLSVPDSPDNARLGMVQVGAQLLDANEDRLATSSRPVCESKRAS